jgi:hypothetical protein
LAKYLGQYPAISTGSLVLNIDAFLSCEFSKSAQNQDFSPFAEDKFTSIN